MPVGTVVMLIELQSVIIELHVHVDGQSMHVSLEVAVPPVQL